MFCEAAEVFSLQVVQKRKENPTEPGAHKDLLDRMLSGVDAKTGEKMTDDSIVDNVWLELDGTGGTSSSNQR